MLVTNSKYPEISFHGSMLSQGDVKEVLYHTSMHPLKVEYHNTHIKPAGKVPMVILYDTPYEFDNKKVGEPMSRYGEIANIRRTTFRVFPSSGLRWEGVC